MQDDGEFGQTTLCVRDPRSSQDSKRMCETHSMNSLGLSRKSRFYNDTKFSGFPQNMESPYAHLADAVSVCWRHRSLGRFQPHRSWWPWHTIFKPNRTYLVGLKNSLYKRLSIHRFIAPHTEWVFYTDIIRWEGLPKWKCSSQLPWTPCSCLTSTVFHLSFGKVELISVFLGISLHIWIVFLRAGTILFCDT